MAASELNKENTKIIQDVSDTRGRFDVNKWTNETRTELLDTFNNIELLDISDARTRDEIIELEKRAYTDYGYGENVEGKEYFSRIAQYENNTFFTIGIRDQESKILKYYMDVYTLSPQEKVFPESQQVNFYNDIENLQDFIDLPGLVFNKVLKDPTFQEPLSTGTKLQLFLIKRLLEESRGSIRIEEQCQPASYRFFEVAERLGYAQIIKKLKVENEAQTEVNRILVKIDPTERTLKFLQKNTP